MSRYVLITPNGRRVAFVEAATELDAQLAIQRNAPGLFGRLEPAGDDLDATLRDSFAALGLNEAQVADAVRGRDADPDRHLPLLKVPYQAPDPRFMTSAARATAGSTRLTGAGVPPNQSKWKAAGSSRISEQRRQSNTTRAGSYSLDLREVTDQGFEDSLAESFRALGLSEAATAHAVKGRG